MDILNQTPEVAQITLSLIHDKALALREKANWLDELEHDLRAVLANEGQTLPAAPKPQSQHDLRAVVRDILLNANDEHKLKRRDIIQRVQEKLGRSVAPIGVISTLSRKSDFKKVEGDSFTLTTKVAKALNE